MKLTKDIDKSIFREYDIRGTYNINLNEDIAYTVGKSYGSYISSLGYTECVIGRDNRYSSEKIASALVTGILETGINIIDLGLVTTPMYYYACIKSGIGRGIMVTASHNPKDDNGFKFSFNNNQNCKGKEIEDFYQYTINQDFISGDGFLTFRDYKDDYLNYLISKTDIKKELKVVIDCGNGTTCFFAPELYSMTNSNLVVLYGKSDPNFPNHHPDPAVDENLKVLQDAVVELKADIGIAFDGDGDRVGIVDDKGRIVRIDVMMALVVDELSKTNPNSKFLYDVKCGMTLINEIKKNNAIGIMARTGNSYTKELTMSNNCIFGGEYSGHVYYRDKFLGIDSGMYAGLRMMELISKTDKKLSEMVDQLDKYYSTPEIKIPTTDEKKFKIVENIKEEIKNRGQEVNETDGIRVNLKDSWFLLRASNTGNNLTFRCEAKEKDSVNKIKESMLKIIDKYNK